MSNSSPSPADSVFEAHALHAVDTSRGKDGLWLVKVPNYLADLWLKPNSDRVVGKVVIYAAESGAPGNQKATSNVRLLADESLLAEAGEDSKLIPRVSSLPFIMPTRSTNLLCLQLQAKTKEVVAKRHQLCQAKNLLSSVKRMQRPDRHRLPHRPLNEQDLQNATQSLVV